jgi:hypothetical protein
MYSIIQVALEACTESCLNWRRDKMRYIVDLCRAKVIGAKDSVFILALKDGDFPRRPSQSYKLKTGKQQIY